MRLKRPEQAIAAIRCPSCRHLFEVESALLQEEPIIAQVVEEDPIDVVVIDDPEPPSSSRPSRQIAPSQQSSDLDLPLGALAVEPVEAPLRPVLPNKKKSNSPPRQASPLKSSTNKRVRIGLVVTAGLMACIVAGYLLINYTIGRSQPSEVEKLGIRYQESLENLRQSILAHQKTPDHQNVDNQLVRLRSLLVDCVNANEVSDSQLNILRDRLNAVEDLQVETRRLASSVSSSFDRSSLIDQIPSMIELTNKQLTYGIRQAQPSRQAVDQFCRAIFSELRQLDRALGKALIADQFDLELIAQGLEELEQTIVDYSQKAEGRSEMSFENKQILECGVAWRGWCLRQLQLSGHGPKSQAITKELDVLASRLDQALKAVAVEKHQLAAIDRLNRRISDPFGTLGTNNAKPQVPSGSASVPASSNGLSEIAASPEIDKSPMASNSEISAVPTKSGSSSEAEPSEASNVSNPFVSIPSESSTSPGASANRGAVRPNGSSGSGTSGPEALTTPATNRSTSVELSSSNPGPPTYFPPARYQGPSSLTIKISSTKSQAELQRLGAAIASRIGNVFDMQVQGSQYTLSFNNFPGKVHEAVKHINFGKVELTDSQSRTLFVNDLP